MMRLEYQLMCPKCVRRHMAGVLFDWMVFGDVRLMAMSREATLPERVRLEVREYWRVTFGEV